MTDTIRPALRQPLADLSLVLDDLSITPAGRRRVVRVLVDRDLSFLAPSDTTSRVKPLTLDEVAEATRAVSDALDEGDLMGTQPYTLEVSSPGVDRPLQGHRAFRRNVGRLVAVVLESGDTLTGRITSVSADRVGLEVPAVKKAPARHHELALGAITSARVQVEFARKDDGPVGPTDELGDGELDDDELDDDDQDDDDQDELEPDDDDMTDSNVADEAADDEETPDGH